MEMAIRREQSTSTVLPMIITARCFSFLVLSLG